MVWGVGVRIPVEWSTVSVWLAQGGSKGEGKVMVSIVSVLVFTPPTTTHESTTVSHVVCHHATAYGEGWGVGGEGGGGDFVLKQGWQFGNILIVNETEKIGTL